MYLSQVQLLLGSSLRQGRAVGETFFKEPDFACWVSLMATGEELIVYVNDEFVPRAQAKISVFDQGVIFGDGVFETLVAVNGYIFKLDRHLDRLFRSAKAVRMTISKTREEVGKALIVETVRRNGLRDADVKIIATRGVGSKPLLGRGDVANPSLIIFAVPPVSVVTRRRFEQVRRSSHTPR